MSSRSPYTVTHKRKLVRVLVFDIGITFPFFAFTVIFLKTIYDNPWKSGWAGDTDGPLRWGWWKWIPKRDFLFLQAWDHWDGQSRTTSSSSTKYLHLKLPTMFSVCAGVYRRELRDTSCGVTWLIPDGGHWQSESRLINKATSSRWLLISAPTAKLLRVHSPMGR